MNTDETIKILATLKAAYPHSFKDLTRRDAENMIGLWTVMFSAESYSEVSASIAAMISTRKEGYSPTIGEVKEKLQSLKTVNELSESDAWALVSKACSNGLYGYKDEFAKLPPEVQRAVGAPEQLKAWAAMDSETVESVVASNFKRGYRTLKEREKETAMLPPAIRQMIGGIADGMKMIKEGDKEK